VRIEQNCRCRSLTAIAGIAVTLVLFGPALARPAGAARQASRPVTAQSLDQHVVVIERRSAKPPKARAKASTSSSHGFHLGKRDDVEIMGLALLPFVGMGLFLFGSGYRREKNAPLGSAGPARRATGSPFPSTSSAGLALRVPQITAWFWVVKGLSTAMGESTSDFLVHAMPPAAAVLLGFAGFAIAMALQFSRRRYAAWSYWFAVVMVGVFGTMAADVLHVGLGVPYLASTALYAVALGAVFIIWQRAEHTLSIHSIDTQRRELFYWAAVASTFALGTAVGDVTALTFHLGYLGSMALFGCVILVPAIGYWKFKWNAILAFWFAYIVTRPLGASFADWLGKARTAKGLGFGAGHASLVLSALIVVVVAYLASTQIDVQRTRDEPLAEG
jgi:uncharacterized membrane-anchored protein